MERTHEDYLQDIIKSIEEIEEFTEDMTFNEFAQDKKTINAVIRSIEVIGEASKKIPETITRKHPEIPWNKMAKMRDKLIHEYFGVDIEIVWKTIKKDIPSVKPSIKKIIENQQ